MFSPFSRQLLLKISCRTRSIGSDFFLKARPFSAILHSFASLVSSINVPDMQSEAEAFLGITKKGSDRPIRRGLLSRRLTWISTLFLAYLASFSWLTGMALCVPYVIMNAPLGITALFHPPINNAAAKVNLGPAEWGVHLVFWTLFLAGLIGCRSLNPWVVRGIFVIVLLILALTMYGCAKYYHCDTSQIN